MTRIGLLAAIALLTVTSHAAPSPTIEVWTRAKGSYGTGIEVAKAARVRVDVGALPPVTREMMDAQVGERRTYRGVALSAVLQKAGPHVGDTVLLRFENGMIVPVALEAGVPVVDPFIALAMRTQGNTWSSEFPPVAKRAEVTLDPRPIAFSWNKVVVETPALRGLRDESGAAFSPWMHVDALVGVEYVNRRAYDLQFRPTDDKDERAQKGAAVFTMACQYCHGVRDTGASYGWDFMLPFPMHTHRKPKDLFSHVTVAKAAALEEGLMMPTQKNLAPADVDALWAWSKALAGDGALRPYTP